MIAIVRIRYRCSECCGGDEMVPLVHGMRSVLEMTRHFAPHNECYRVISGRSGRFGEIGRKMWLTPTGRVSLEFYDKTKHAFMTGCIVHVPYPMAPVRGKLRRGGVLNVLLLLLQRLSKGTKLEIQLRWRRMWQSQTWCLRVSLTRR